MDEQPEQNGRRDNDDHRSGDGRRSGGLGVDPCRGLFVEPLRVRQDLLLHQLRGLGQVRRAHRIAHPVVGAGDLDQPGVDRELRVDPAQHLDQRRIGQSAGGLRHRDRGIGDGLLVTLPDRLRFGARDERGRGCGIRHRQRGVQLARGEGERLGVVENVGELLLTFVDRRRDGECAQDTERGEHDAEGQDASGSGTQEPPPGVGGLDRRPLRQWLGRGVRQLNGHLSRTSLA